MSCLQSLITDLRDLIADLGRDGGLISPSLYDTAQVLRFCPAETDEPAVRQWLLQQQYADGGWGDPSIPLARHVPTLAAILALGTDSSSKQTAAAIEAGHTFLIQHSAEWSGPVAQDIPLAAELLIPYLLTQHEERYQAMVPYEPYTKLTALGNRRRQLIASMTHRPGTAPTHSWESWGTTAERSFLDRSGSVGHSPAATAAWLHCAHQRPDLADERAAGRRYLEQSATATGVNILGVVPTVWPYPRNEQTVSMYAVLLAGLLDHPALTDVVTAQVEDMWRGLRAEGQGINDHFICDGDITAMVFAVVAAFGYNPDISVLQRFIIDGSCLTYPNELQRSNSATAHAAHTLALLNDDPEPLLNYVCEQRASDHRWLVEKWHTSWLYLTSHMLHALISAGWTEQALETLPALLAQQRPDGSWGVTTAVVEETAYGVLALLAFEQAGILPGAGQAALHRAGRYLLNTYTPGQEALGACWAAKELYRPRRISRVIEVSATLACVLKGYGTLC